MENILTPDQSASKIQQHVDYAAINHNIWTRLYLITSTDFYIYCTIQQHLQTIQIQMLIKQLSDRQNSLTARIPDFQ